jgi:hypothetical protein
MKLGGVLDGVVYCTYGRKVGTWDESNGFQTRGNLPNPNRGARRLGFGVMRWSGTRYLLRPVTGWYTTTNVWPLGGDHLLGTSGRWVFASSDGGRTWETVHELPPAAGPMGVLPTSLCAVDGRTYLAEYPIGGDDARVLVSDDRGRTWSPFVTRSDIRHFHGVFYDPYEDQLWGTTGDADQESAIGTFVDGEFHPVGRGSQLWRAVGLAFTPKYVLWGMDCSFATGVSILRLSRDELESESPEPVTVGTADCSVFYADTITAGDETWVILSTAAESGVDTYAPPENKRNTCGRTARVIASPESDDFESWYELYSFTRPRTLAELTRRIPSASAYVFQEHGPDNGLLVNPYNVAGYHGDILTVPESMLDPSCLEAYHG